MKLTKKGFTLVELMVVIAIIGILAVAGISQYSQYQARARDTARIQNIPAASTALGIYFTDMWEYPAEKTTGCLSDATGKVTDAFWEYLPKAPLDPQKNSSSLPCKTAPALGYKVLERWWVAKAGFFLTTNVETYQKANADASKLTAAKYEDISKNIWVLTPDKLKGLTQPNSVYVVAN